MKYVYCTERDFENRTGLSNLMKAYAKQQIEKGEKLDFTSARQDKHHENIYTAEYCVLDSTGKAVYSLAVKLDTHTNVYSFVRSDIQ